MNIHCNFIGGNIKVSALSGNDVYLENQIRDSSEDWFYWAFCIEGAGNRTLRFHMQQNRLGYWGPAISHDLKSWRWLEHSEGDSFIYSFSENENKVYFAHSLLYHPERFSELVKELSINVFELCKSRKKRSVPACLMGSGNRSVILTARHHACESTGSYVLEGVLRELALQPISDARILCVPFVDYDGVVDGDQGKARKPHDHNRDYSPKGSIYPETSAIRSYADTYGCHYGFDFHSPWHKGGENDTFFIVRPDAEKEARTERFSRILEKQITPRSMHYVTENDHRPSVGWNRPSFAFGYTMMHRAECELAHSFESAYFGTADNKTTPEGLIELGRCYARAIREYMESR